jgi:polysaccharide export outer membrane protein
LLLQTKKRISSFFPLSLLLAFLIVSCVSGPTPKEEIVSPEKTITEIESSQTVKAMNERILMSSLSSKSDPYRDYKIGPEDLLEISVFEVEKLNKTVRVSSQGNISLHLLGVLRVKGLTANELEREIRELLAEKYLQDPHVSVFIKEYRSQRISVMGAVEEPNVFNVTGQKTILDMLAMAGGVKDDAGHLLFLIRPPALEDEVPGALERAESPESTERDEVPEVPERAKGPESIERAKGLESIEGTKHSEGGRPKTFVINLEELLIKGDLTLNLPLKHGDVINVPVSGKVFVGGEVWRPGGFILAGKRMTLSQAIVLAGGVKPQAKGSDTKIFRYSEKGTGREILSANVYAIQKGQEDDLYVKENDIIIVPRHGVKAFFVGVKETLTGVFTMGYSLGSI